MKRLFIYFFPNTFLWFLGTKFYTRLQFVGEYEKMVQRINKGVFIRAKLKETREDIRREYDKVNEDLEAIKSAQVRNSALVEPNKDVTDSLTKGIEGKTKDIEQLKLQIDQIDKQISEPGGVEEQIQSYYAILPLIKELIKKGK